MTVLYLEQTSISSVKTIVSGAALVDQVRLGCFMLPRFKHAFVTNIMRNDME